MQGKRLAKKQRFQVVITQAFFYLIRDTEMPDDATRVSLALPDTTEFRRRMAGLKDFCLRRLLGRGHRPSQAMGRRRLVRCGCQSANLEGRQHDLPPISTRMSIVRNFFINGRSQ